MNFERLLNAKKIKSLKNRRILSYHKKKALGIKKNICNFSLI